MRLAKTNCWTRVAVGVTALSIAVQGTVAMAEPVDEQRLSADEPATDRTPQELVIGLLNVAATYPGGLDAVLSMFTTGPCTWVLDVGAASPECAALIDDIADAATSPDVSLAGEREPVTLDCVLAVLEDERAPDDPCLGASTGLIAPLPVSAPPPDDEVLPPPDLAPPVPVEPVEPPPNPNPPDPGIPPDPGDPGGGAGNGGGNGGNVGGGNAGNPPPPRPFPPFCCSAPPVYFPPFIPPGLPPIIRPPGLPPGLPPFRPAPPRPPPQPPPPPPAQPAPPAQVGPKVIALGDAMTSGHVGGTGPNRDMTVCDHPLTSYADNLKVQLGVSAVNVAHSGASTSAVLDRSPFIDSCGGISQQAHPQIADAVLALRATPSQPGRRNVSVITAGMSDTNLLAVLGDIVANPGGAADSPQACRDRIAGAWNGPAEGATISANVASIVTQLATADPQGHVRYVLYANFGAGDPLLPAACAAAVGLAVGALNQWITTGAVAGQLALARAGGNPFQVATVTPHCARAWVPARNFVQDSLRSFSNGQQVPGYPNPNNRGRDDIADCVRASVLGSHDTKVGRQLDWFLLATRFPGIITPDDFAGRFTPTLQQQVPFANFRATVLQLSPLVLRDIIPGHTPHQVLARVVTPGGQIRQLKVVVEPVGGRIAGITVTGDPLAPEPIAERRPLATSWNAVDTRLAALAPVRGLFVSEVGANGCRAIHGFNPGGVGPVGSVFKTFILGELADQIRAGQASWDQLYAVNPRDRVTQLLASEPVGTPLSLRTYAADMIWMSDNTATDHLLFRLGRTNVEAQQFAFGTANPARNVPFPSAREAFVLKYVNHPVLLNQYLTQNPDGRRALLDGPIANIPTPTGGGSATPRAIDTVEWFFSPRDTCGALAGLYGQAADPGLAPIADIMSIADLGLGLSAQNWRTTWYKGGSEGGVFSIAFLAEAADGRVYTVTALLANTARVFDEPFLVRELRALARSSFALAAGTGT